MLVGCTGMPVGCAGMRMGCAGLMLDAQEASIGQTEVDDVRK